MFTPVATAAAVIGHHVFDIADQMEFCSLINPNEPRQQRYMTVFIIHSMCCLVHYVYI